MVGRPYSTRNKFQNERRLIYLCDFYGKMGFELKSLLMNKLVILLFVFMAIGCTEQKSIEQTIEIREAINSIEENMDDANAIEPIERRLTKQDGPYPADEYSMKPTGKFHFLTLFVQSKDSTWITIDATSEDEILSAYPKLIVFKVRPKWISREKWSQYRLETIKRSMVFDLNEKPKGWLKENSAKLK